MSDELKTIVFENMSHLAGEVTVSIAAGLLRKCGIDVPEDVGDKTPAMVRVSQLREAFGIEGKEGGDGAGYFDEDGEPFEFSCPDCGGEHFGRDKTPDGWTTTCLNGDCDYVAQDGADG